MSMTVIMGTILALALWVLAVPPKPPAKRKAGPGDGNGIAINIYQHGSTILPKVVVRDSKGE